MESLGKGMLAGFIATIVLSALMILKTMIGLMPELDVAEMLGAMMKAGSAAGWLAHFVIGTIAWGGLFALLEHRIPGHRIWLKGVEFGLGAWLLMMVLVMPMAGKGLFGLDLGLMAPIMTLTLHVVYGAVLGASYAASDPDHARMSFARW
jgi:uncharacterized membrane protein YagU involved in acid resistance